MGIRFAPHDGTPILFDSAATKSTPSERGWPSGWWILPAIIVGLMECAAIIVWIVT